MLRKNQVKQKIKILKLKRELFLKLLLKFYIDIQI